VEGKTSLYDDPKSGRPLTNDLTEAISSMGKERPYVPCKTLCQHFRIVKGTCLPVHHDTLGMKKFHCRWVPQALDTNQKAERVTLSHGILLVLQSVRPAGLQNVITEDESRSFLYYSHDSISASSRDEISESVSQKNDSEKCLISLLSLS
jgi:hypothetical protein